MPIATVTSKGQITIPIDVRSRLGLKAGDRVSFDFGQQGELILRPKRLPFEALRGILKSKRRRPASVREMDKGIMKYVQARWLRASGRAK
jgi:AbrB family looped-hinge helix DNA binding protein